MNVSTSLPQPHDPARVPRALVVSPGSELRALLVGTLSGDGFQVEVTESAGIARQRWNELAPDVVLLDLAAADRCDAPTRTRLRGLLGSGSVPLLLVGPGDRPELARCLQEWGAADLLRTPVAPDTLGVSLRHHLRLAAALRQLNELELRLRRTQLAARMVEWSWDPGAACLRFLQDPTPILGEEAPSADRPWQWVHPDDRSRVKDAIAAAFQSGEPLELEHRVLLRPQESRVVVHDAQLCCDGKDGSTRLLGTMRDVTELRTAEQAAQRLSHTDPLTGLPNREFLFQHLNSLIAHCRESHGNFALLALDLDLFKRINDTMGHRAGDELIQAVAVRIKESLRQGEVSLSSPESLPSRLGDTLVRLDGDSFAAVIVQIRRGTDSAIVAERICRRLMDPITIQDQEVVITASIGISLYPQDAQNAETLLAHAETAMHQAKRDRRSSLRMYRWEFNAHANRRLSLESALRHAIERQQMCVAYQPRVSLSRHRVVGVEALLRWRHPEEGWISPQEFIPVAEDTGLIVPLGYWVLRTALFQLQEWHDAGHADLRLAVNLSCRQFREEKLEAEIERTLWESQAASRHVDIEITESTLMDNTEISRSVLRSLKCLGFGIALDDFGTGYSSLSYLKRFPIDILKIDKTFVRDIPDDPDSSAITAALIALARALHMEVVAEGVETLAQLEYLRDQGCDEMQGYLFSHAIAAAAVPTFLESYARNEPSFVEPVES